MDERSIALYDSGAGGLEILERLTSLYPNENYLYFSDRNNFPYGNKPKELICKLAEKKISEIFAFAPKVLIFACNTLSTAVLDGLKSYPVKIIGVKPFVADGKKTLLVCTKTTASSDYVKRLKDKNPLLDVFIADGLAEEVEAFVKDGTEPNLEKLFSKVDRDYDCVSLGCTHYTLIKDRFSSLFPKSEIIDGGNVVLKQIQGLVPTNKSSGEKGDIYFADDVYKEFFYSKLASF